MSDPSTTQPVCPQCAQSMNVARFRCERCDCHVDGSFDMPPLARLTADEQALVMAFVREHGSIRKMEAIFGISYPTVKNRLNAITKKFDAAFAEPDSRGMVLDKLAKGEINVAQALELLDQAQGGEKNG